MLPHEISLPLSPHAGEMYRTLALDMPDHLGFARARATRSETDFTGKEGWASITFAPVANVVT
jgi:hypothetical protein